MLYGPAPLIRPSATFSHPCWRMGGEGTRAVSLPRTILWIWPRTSLECLLPPRERVGEGGRRPDEGADPVRNFYTIAKMRRTFLTLALLLAACAHAPAHERLRTFSPLTRDERIEVLRL